MTDIATNNLSNYLHKSVKSENQQPIQSNKTNKLIK
jgi:hypothetical protein